MCVGVESFFRTVLNGNEWKASPSGRLNPIRMPDIRYLGGWLDPFNGHESDNSPLLAILTHSSSPKLVILLPEHQIHKHKNKQRLLLEYTNYGKTWTIFINLFPKTLRYTNNCNTTHIIKLINAYSFQFKRFPNVEDLTECKTIIIVLYSTSYEACTVTHEQKKPTSKDKFHSPDISPTPAQLWPLCASVLIVTQRTRHTIHEIFFCIR